MSLADSIQIKTVNKIHFVSYELRFVHIIFTISPVACPAGKYGPRCGGDCPACVNGHCDSATGSCVCKSGWTGSLCETGEFSFLPPTNEVCEGYFFTGACLSTGGGHAWQGGMCGGGHAWQGGHVWQGAWIAGGVHGRGHAWQGGKHGTHAPPRHILWDTVNEWAVRILLECILVINCFWLI